MNRDLPSIGALSLGVFLVVASGADAALIDLTGDYGANTYGANAIPLPVNSGVVTTNFFQAVPGFGSLTGQVDANNINGIGLSLSITNVIFNAIAPASGSFTDITLVVAQDYTVASVPGAFIAQHQLGGNWSGGTGNYASLDTAIVQLDGTSQTLPFLSILNTPSVLGFGLSGGPISGPTPFPTITVLSTLILRIDGVGITNLPGSADVDVTIVPAPAAASVLACAGPVALTRRRRR